MDTALPVLGFVAGDFRSLGCARRDLSNSVLRFACRHVRRAFTLCASRRSPTGCSCFFFDGGELFALPRQEEITG